MSQRWKGAVFLPIGLAVMAGAIYDARETHRSIARSATAPGLVVAEDHGVHHPYVRFTTRAGETRTYPQGGEVTQRVGDRVTVRYDPHDPQVPPSLDTFGALWGTALGLAGLGGVFAVVGGGLLLARPTPGGEPPGAQPGRAQPHDRPAPADAAFEALCAHLPALVRYAFPREVWRVEPPPHSAQEMFKRAKGRLISAGVAEGRGGYPGGRGKPGWCEYVEAQRRNVAVLRALVDAFGAPCASISETLRSYDESFPPTKRLMGEGYEPHVDDVAGRLIYSLPVESSIVSSSFYFPITAPDFEVLIDDPWRRAVLATVAHALLQRSMIRGEPEVTEIGFSHLIDGSLHSTAEELSDFIRDFNLIHNINIRYHANRHLYDQKGGKRADE